MTAKVRAHKLRSAADFLERYGLNRFVSEFPADGSEILVINNAIRPAIADAEHIIVERLRRRADEIEGRT